MKENLIENKDELLIRIQQLESENKHLLKVQSDFENLLSTDIDGIWCKRISKHGKEELKFVSTNINKILGYSEDFLFEDNLKTILHPQDKKKYETKIEELKSGKSSSIVLEFRIVLPDKKIKWIKDKINIRKDKRGNFILTGILIDITKKKFTEVEIKKYSDDLKDLNITKDKFFSLIAHDLRNPFNAIMGFAEILNDDYDLFSDEERKEYIKNIKEASDGTYKLLQNLLEWSRAQSGQMAYKPTENNLRKTINETISTLKSQADKKNIQILVSIDTNLNVYSDENMTKTILRNLISNAIKFTYNGGNIEIFALQEKDFVKISIKDSGIGIDKNNIDKLFRLDEKYRMIGTDNEVGTGLGLIICKELVEKNGGNISVESEEGNGSIFNFTLPLT